MFWKLPLCDVTEGTKPSLSLSSLPTKTRNRVSVVVVIFAAGCKNGWRGIDFVLLCPPLEVVGFEQTTPLFAGEGSEEIGNLIENYIKEIEELRYVKKTTKKTLNSN